MSVLKISELKDSELLDLYEDWIKINHYDPHNSYDRMKYSYLLIKQEILRRLRTSPENEH